MDFKFGKDSGDSQTGGAPGEKKNQSALLVLLLILVGGFAYLYFFTSLIKPQEAQKSPEAPVSAPQAAKMPLPAREGGPAKPEEKTPDKAVTAKAAATVPVPAAAPAVKPAATPVKPAPAAKPQEEPKKIETAKPAGKKPQPVQVAENKAEKAAPVKTEAAKPAAEAKKPVTADKKSVPAKEGVKKATSDVPAKNKSVAKASKAAPESWSLVVGNYVLEEALSADMGRVRKAGFEPIVKPAPRKKTRMSRLFVSESEDRSTAQSTLEKLQRHTSDAFVIEQGGRFTVYAGSYLQSEAANSEKTRLKAAGFAVTVKHADIAIPSQSLSIGPFKEKKAADAALGKLRSAGIKATPLKK